MKPSFKLLSALVGLLCLSDAVAQTTGFPHRNRKIGEPSPSTDPLAGMSIRSPDLAHRVVASRLYNPPTVGEKAPKTLVTEALTGKPFLLSDISSKKEVILFFASTSCNCSQASATYMSDLARKYSDRYYFLLIYIREAHPLNGFLPPEGPDFQIQEPANFPERAAAALKFAQFKKIPFPILVDSMDDMQAVQWGAWPTRIFVINKSGTVIYAGQQGPWFTKPVKDFDMKLKGAPESIGSLPGYSTESLEEFLIKEGQKLPKLSP